ncbi:MAG: sigma-E factor negative regulatory protein [Burkholderiales bacterium]|nr:sigma-E factor negative regulatory protein [Burkholderiales bacterium]
MATESEQRAVALERLSALVDGELDAAALAQACAHWREGAEVRCAWHAYHLIGDVLRSDDLASEPARDAAFIQALRTRLASEPVVLAPRAAVATAASPSAGLRVGGTSRRWSWMAPTVVAAGFVAVAGVLLLTRVPATSPGRPVDAALALAAPPGALAPRGAAPAMANELASADAPQQSLVASGQLIRDARLDRYLEAHQQFAGSSALGVPSGYLRSATAVITPDR